MKQDLLATLAGLERTLEPEYRIVPHGAPDLPVFLATAVPLAPHVTGRKPRLPSGRGTSLAQAMVSAGAEALELRSSLAQNNLARIAALPQQDGRAMVAARDMAGGEVVLVPAQEVFLDLAATTGEAPVADARSTGCATAPDIGSARRLGLFECIERDAIAFWWHGGAAASALSIALIDQREPRLSWSLERRSRRFRLLGLRSDIGVPVVLAVSSDLTGRNVVFGAAARFEVADAAVSAATEMVQTEVSFARAVRAGNSDAVNWLAYASDLILAQFDPPMDGPHPTWRQLDDALLLRRLAELGLRALAVELTLDGDPLPSARVLVPGLCEMGGRVDQPRFRRFCGIDDPMAPVPRHEPEPF